MVYFFAYFFAIVLAYLVGSDKLIQMIEEGPQNHFSTLIT
jgi:hypothetical protein